jgi:cytochrome c-type biogenesis protein CcmH
MSSFLAIAGALVALTLAALLWPLRAHGRATLVAVSAFTLVLTAGGYAWLGSSQHLAPAPASAPAEPPPVMQAIAQFSARVQQDPTDAHAWAQLARARAALGRDAEAQDALETAARLRPRDANLLASHADFLARLHGGRIDDPTHALVHRALALEPTQPVALTLAAMAAQQRGQHAQAAQFWERLAATMKDNDPLRAEVMARARAAQAAATP